MPKGYQCGILLLPISAYTFGRWALTGISQLLKSSRVGPASGAEPLADARLYYLDCRVVSREVPFCFFSGDPLEPLPPVETGLPFLPVGALLGFALSAY